MSAPAKYRKKPVVIEAMHWDSTDDTSLAVRNWAEPGGVAIVDTDHIQHLWDYDAGCYIMPSGKMIHAPYRTRCLIVLTLEGEMIAAPGWWIIKGVQGEFYPCEPDIFEKTYTEELLAGLAEPCVIPEGYEPQENSHAKNHAMDALEAALEKQGVEVYTDDDEGGIDLINLADAVVEALIKAGVTIPENISNPHGH